MMLSLVYVIVSSVALILHAFGVLENTLLVVGVACWAMLVAIWSILWSQERVIRGNRTIGFHSDRHSHIL